MQMYTRSTEESAKRLKYSKILLEGRDNNHPIKTRDSLQTKMIKFEVSL
jgi:hypothetical protein